MGTQRRPHPHRNRPTRPQARTSCHGQTGHRAKTPVKEADIPATVEKLLEDIQDNMFAKAKAILQEKTTLVKTMRNSRSGLKRKAASSRQHGAAARSAKQKSRMKQAQPSASDLSKKKRQTWLRFLRKRSQRSRVLRKVILTNQPFLFLFFNKSVVTIQFLSRCAISAIRGEHLFFRVSKCSGYR